MIPSEMVKPKAILSTFHQGRSSLTSYALFSPAIMAQVPFKAPQAEPNPAYTAPAPTTAPAFSSPNVFDMSADASRGRICWKAARSVFRKLDPVDPGLASLSNKMSNNNRTGNMLRR